MYIVRNTFTISCKNLQLPPIHEKLISYNIIYIPNNSTTNRPLPQLTNRTHSTTRPAPKRVTPRIRAPAILGLLHSAVSQSNQSRRTRKPATYTKSLKRKPDWPPYNLLAWYIQYYMYSKCFWCYILERYVIETLIRPQNIPVYFFFQKNITINSDWRFCFHMLKLSIIIELSICIHFDNLFK